jgi:hypothetical protein
MRVVSTLAIVARCPAVVRGLRTVIVLKDQYGPDRV